MSILKKSLESDIQAKCIKYAQAQGWVVLKVISSNINGISDLILFKNGQTIFIEVKGEKTKIQPLQLYRQKQFRELGFICEIVRSVDELTKIILNAGRKSDPNKLVSKSQRLPAEVWDQTTSKFRREAILTALGTKSIKNE